MAADESEYSKIHSKYHPIIRSYLKKFGYYDIFLVDHRTGHIVYTVFKEADYATSLITGPYKDTNFAEAFDGARRAPGKNFVKLVDFEQYDPSYAAPASFIASPIFDGDQKIGILLFQMPIDKINYVMTGAEIQQDGEWKFRWKEDGLGNSGETYLVSVEENDFKMRSVSRFLLEDPDGYFEALGEIGTDRRVIEKIAKLNTSILLQEVRTDAAKEAQKGNTNTRIINDYRGIPVLSSYKPLKIQDVNWIILSEIDESEAFAPIARFARQIQAVPQLGVCE